MRGTSIAIPEGGVKPPQGKPLHRGASDPCMTSMQIVPPAAKAGGGAADRATGKTGWVYGL
jgi:hypothetical protein